LGPVVPVRDYLAHLWLTEKRPHTRSQSRDPSNRTGMAAVSNAAQFEGLAVAGGGVSALTADIL